MNIRSVTGFINLTANAHASDFRILREFYRAARENFTSAGFPVQTVRLATQSLAEIAPRNLKEFARELSVVRPGDADYISLGALPGEHPLMQALPDALASTANVFGAAHIAAFNTGINLTAIKNSARVMRALSESTDAGFGNLRFAALANCPPHSPFFPAAYHDGGTPAFALATEAAPLAVDAFHRATSLTQARANLIDAIENASNAIVPIANELAARFNFRFAGIDFSLAPFPQDSHSIGTAIEKLTGAKFGEQGTLFASAFLTDCINRAKFPRTGFSGLMFPVLEDSTLGANSPRYALDSLLLYSTVCGTGLDTIPLPGDTSADALAAILLDLATLAVKLNKPLTARLMPLPGLHVGDPTHFEFEYFARAHVMSPNASALKFFARDDRVEFISR
jgi:uncharacterized protein (UPF0210 family)